MSQNSESWFSALTGYKRRSSDEEGSLLIGQSRQSRGEAQPRRRQSQGKEDYYGTDDKNSIAESDYVESDLKKTDHNENHHGGDVGSKDDDGFLSDDDSDVEEWKDHKPVSRADIVTFIGLVVVTFISWVAVSIMAPYFPNEAHRRGMSDMEVGAIFSLQSLTAFILCPFVGKFIPKIGGKVTLVTGLFTEATGNILFGMCATLHHKVWFMTFCLLTRILVGAGVAMAVTSTMAINANTFPNHIARTVGILELTVGVGLLLGPIFGGALYEAGGSSFMLPFVVVGAIDLGSMLMALIILPKPKREMETTGSVSELLRIPMVWPIAFTSLVGSMSLSFLEPTLSVRGSIFTDNALHIGLLFLLPSGCYAISSVVWGCIGDTYKVARTCIVIALIIDALAFFLLGPSPVLHLPDKMWLLCIGLAILGIADGGIIVNSISDMFQTAVLYGLPEDMRTHGVVSGVFNSAYALGTVFGPWVAGGVLFEYYGFQVTTSLLSVLLLATAFMVIVCTVVERRWIKRNKKRGRRLRDVCQIKTPDPVPETAPLFQQPKIVTPDPKSYR